MGSSIIESNNKINYNSNYKHLSKLSGSSFQYYSYRWIDLSVNFIVITITGMIIDNYNYN